VEVIATLLELDIVTVVTLGGGIKYATIVILGMISLPLSVAQRLFTDNMFVRAVSVDTLSVPPLPSRLNNS
jgi:hypothetical protein